MAPEEIEIAEVIRDMSTFEEVLTAAVLAMILGVIGNILSKMWEDGSKLIKFLVFVFCIISIIVIITFAHLKGWIHIPIIGDHTMPNLNINEIRISIAQTFYNIWQILSNIWTNFISNIWTNFKSQGTVHKYALITSLVLTIITAVIAVIIVLLGLLSGNFDMGDLNASFIFGIFEILAIVIIFSLCCFFFSYPLAFGAAYWCVGKLWIYILLSVVIFIIFVLFWLVFFVIITNIIDIGLIYIILPVIVLLIEYMIFLLCLGVNSM